MTTLFTAEIIRRRVIASYTVTFEEDQYHFSAADNTMQNPPFSLYREHDEWKVNGDLDEIALGQATAQLETYLLSQH